MEQNLVDEIHKLRNEFAHGLRTFGPADVAKYFSEIDLSTPSADLYEFTALMLQIFEKGASLYYVPQSILSVFAKLLDGKSTSIVCDPWAGIGIVLATVRETTQATKALAFTMDPNDAVLGRVLLSAAEWPLVTRASC